MDHVISGKELVKLKNMVVASFSSSNWVELGVLTGFQSEIENHPRLFRSLSFGDDDYEGLAFSFLRMTIGKNGENLKEVKDYIYEVCGTPGDYISSKQMNQRHITFSPNIFEVPDTSVDSRLISVMMPFTSQLQPVYEMIKEVSSELGFECKRADDIWEHSTVIQDVFSLIFTSYIVVCDFTGKNPNVFYEAGIAHTLGKHVIPITQSADDVPFDLRHHRYATYLNNGEGRAKLKGELRKRFLHLSSPN